MVQEPDAGTESDAMTVAEVRRALSLLRKRWDQIVSEQVGGEQAHLMADLDFGPRGKLCIRSFALKFILGQHSRRLPRDGGPSTAHKLPESAQTAAAAYEPSGI